MPPIQPTTEIYDELQRAYDVFNEALFAKQLPACLITLQRVKRTYGYFEPGKFIRRSGHGKCDEIALNPAYFGICPPEEVLQTILHEMVHLWQHHFGEPGRGRYHNAQWANKMESVGLMPSSTGKPGGKRTGDHVIDYPIPDGRFEALVAKLAQDGFEVPWCDRQPAAHVAMEALETALDRVRDTDLAGTRSSTETAEPTVAPWATGPTALPPGLDINPDTPAKINRSNRMKYQCLPCRINVWGKPGLQLVCGVCGSQFSESLP
jgi:hypothetical protein